MVKAQFADGLHVRQPNAKSRDPARYYLAREAAV